MPGPVRLAIAALSAFLLISFGAQIVAAPLTVPALWWAARSTKTLPGRAVLTVIAALTMVFVGWGIAYLAAGEDSPLIVALPIVSALATGVVFVRTTTSSRTASS